ncbi:unnamed protein product [Mytilus edulis]|uniref:C-type lectin domain-containing protein n=1 Tax=Mytilus edulis TaxID=6550 RepID=A0A8S3V8V7_MYTED|nr:unnamed protein product [Mytilus edulis]
MEIIVVVTLSFLVCICNGNVFGSSTQSAAEADTKETGIQSDINVLKDNMHQLLKRVSKNENEIASLKRENQYLTNELENKRRQFLCEINVLHENTNEHQQLLNDTKTEIIYLSSSFKETIEELKNRVDKLERMERQKSEENKTECIDKPDFWLDGSEKFEEGVWVWTTSGQKFNVTDWYTTEPNNKNNNEHCLKFVAPKTTNMTNGMMKIVLAI